MSEATDRLYGAALIVDEQLRIIKDRYGLYSELKMKHDLLSEECDAAAKAIDAMEMMHDGLGREYKLAKTRIEFMELAVSDLEVQAKFWRQAAEHAVEGWNKLEEKYEDLLGRVRALVKSDTVESVNAAYSALEDFDDTREEWAPPEPAPDSFDPAPGLHIVEEEKPR